MPLRSKVTLMPHDPRWAALAQEEASRIRHAVGPVMVEVHHIGSTAIPGIAAKPIIDLLGVASSLADLDSARAGLEELGFEWRGEFGLSGRRYLIRNDPWTGQRVVQLHCYSRGDAAIDRHLAFRDFLRAWPELAAEYEREKFRCASLHPKDSHAYSDGKDAWIKRVESDALKFD